MQQGKVQVKGQTYPIPYKTRTLATVLERQPPESFFPKSQAPLCFWEELATSNKQQEKAVTCFNSHLNPNQGDEFFFYVMLWDKSLLFFVASGGVLVLHLGEGRRLIQDITSGHQTVGGCQIRPGQSTPGFTLNSPQSWTSQPEGRMPLESSALAGLQ